MYVTIGSLKISLESIQAIIPMAVPLHIFIDA